MIENAVKNVIRWNALPNANLLQLILEAIDSRVLRRLCFCCMGWPNNYSIFPGHQLFAHVSAKTPELYVIPSGSVLYFKIRPEFQKNGFISKKTKIHITDGYYKHLHNVRYFRVNKSLFDSIAQAHLAPFILTVTRVCKNTLKFLYFEYVIHILSRCISHRNYV